MTPPPANLWIEGYASPVSLAPGADVALCVSTPASEFSIEIARIGKERQVVFKQEDVKGGERSIPENAATHGCGWPTSFTLKIPADWASGYYEVTFRATDGGGSFTQRCRRTAEASAYFIVRAANPGAQSKILLQLSTNTYEAYNNWNGRCLYAYNAADHIQGRRVSFARPPASQFGSWESSFVKWAEGAGYKLEYAANLDLELQPGLLDNYRLVLSVGHDEYWSWGMRDALEAYIGQGGNVAFLSGNTCCWQVRPEDKGAALTCYKQAFAQDPLYGQGHDNLLSTLWSHRLVGRTENSLTGVGFLWGGYHLSHGQFMEGSGAYNVHRPEHWLFEGTGLRRGDAFGSKDTIVGYECDGCEFTIGPDGLPVPTHSDGTPKDFQILATAPARWAGGDGAWYDGWDPARVGAAVIGSYTRGGTVVTVGATDWAHGLKGGDPVVDRITRNILDRLGK